MSQFTSPRIHPTAIIDPEAELAPDVRVGAFVIIEGKVQVGPGCVIGPRSHLIGPLTMGAQNQVFDNVILGGRPQHLKYNDEPTSVEIGDRNTFRENVTVHRGTTHSWQTRIGSDNFFMTSSHVAHDCQIGNHCLLVNNALLGGHCILNDHAYVSGNSGVHQFCRVGRFAFIGGLSCATKDLPPFLLLRGFNDVHGINVVGLRRAGFTSQQIGALRRLYHILFLHQLSLPNALAQAERELGEIDVIQEFISFVRQSKRGICRAHSDDLDLAA
jgi:UDP-N-acetylglucosamine acyltransferase